MEQKTTATDSGGGELKPLTSDGKRSFVVQFWGCLLCWLKMGPAPLVLGFAAFVAACGSFAYSSSDFRQRINTLGVDSRLQDFWHHHVPITSGFLGFAVAVGVWLLRKAIQTPDNEKNGGAEFFFNAGVPLAAGGYFLYQIGAGALFATTTISVKAARCVNNIVVSVTLERGDNWLVDVTADEYLVGQQKPGRAFDHGWKAIGFQRNRNDVLRLAPKERTSATFVIEPDLKNGISLTGDTFVTVAIDQYSILWPVASESFANVLVLKRPQSEREDSCPAAKDISDKETRNEKPEPAAKT